MDDDGFHLGAVEGLAQWEDWAKDSQGIRAEGIEMKWSECRFLSAVKMLTGHGDLLQFSGI